MAEPGHALQVGVEDEAGDRDRPEPAHDRRQLVDGDEEERERAQGEEDDLPGRRAPRGSSRPAVRGFRASILASMSRFSAIAKLRAPTIATVIQTRSAALGTPSTARKAPTYAKGSAKTVCSSLTSDEKSFA